MVIGIVYSFNSEYPFGMVETCTGTLEFECVTQNSHKRQVTVDAYNEKCRVKEWTSFEIRNERLGFNQINNSPFLVSMMTRAVSHTV
jgi:hypothetical protein